MTGQWLYWGSAIVVALGGTVLLAWALFSDRPRGRKRCPKCWYAMKDAPSLRCPECGHEVNREKKLYKTRRRWKWVLASLVPFALAGYLAVQPKVQRDGWGSVMPATILIVLLRFDDRQWVLQSIEYHVSDVHTHPAMGTPMPVPNEEHLWDWQWKLLGRVVLDRIDDEHRSSVRVTYHSWLSCCREYANDPELARDITAAFEREVRHHDPHIRGLSALRSIDYADIPGSHERLLLLVNDEEHRVRMMALSAFALLATYDESAVEPIIDALQDEHPDVRTSAVASIGWIEQPRDVLASAYNAVVSMDDDPHGEVRYWRIHTLARMQDEDDAWQTMQQAMQSDDLHTRRGGFSEAASRDELRPEIVPLIIGGLDDDDAETRHAAAFQLRRYPTEHIVEHREELEALAGHHDNSVVQAVIDALSRIMAED